MREPHSISWRSSQNKDLSPPRKKKILPAEALNFHSDIGPSLGLQPAGPTCSFGIASLHNPVSKHLKVSIFWVLFSGEPWLILPKGWSAHPQALYSCYHRELVRKAESQTPPWPIVQNLHFIRIPTGWAYTVNLEKSYQDDQKFEVFFPPSLPPLPPAPPFMLSVYLCKTWYLPSGHWRFFYFRLVECFGAVKKLMREIIAGFMWLLPKIQKN